MRVLQIVLIVGAGLVGWKLWSALHTGGDGKPTGGTVPSPTPTPAPATPAPVTPAPTPAPAPAPAAPAPAPAPVRRPPISSGIDGAGFAPEPEPAEWRPPVYRGNPNR